jgi:hypothetical protein
MIKRSYFYKVESVPLLRQQRIDDGLITCAIGIVHCWSWLPNYSLLCDYIYNDVINSGYGLNKGEIMITQLSRL